VYLAPAPEREAAVVVVVKEASSLEEEASERLRVPRLMMSGRSGFCLRRVGKRWVAIRFLREEGESGVVRGVEA
jgi:hypothetical protein